MPKISTYGESRVTTQVTPGARASSQQVAGIGDFAGALNNVATTIDTIQQKVDTTSAEEALVNFEREKNDMFFNPETGFFNSKGRNAFDSARGASEGLAELKKKYATELKSPRAREMFGKASDAHITRGNADIMRHASTQLEAWETATIKSRAENSLETAYLYWNNDDQLKVQNSIGRNSVLEAAKREGITGEALNERLQTFDSSFAKGVITAATANSADAGKDALSKYGKLLEGPDKLSIDGMIAKREKAENTQKIAQQAVLMSTNLVSDFGDEHDARTRINESVDKIKDPDLRKETSKEAMRQLDLKIRADNEERANIFTDAERFIMDGGSATSLQATNPEAWEKLEPKDQRKLLSGETIVTDQIKFNDLMLLPTRELAKVDPNKHASDLSIADRNKLRVAVKSARNGGSEHQVGRTRAAETTAAINQIFGKKPSSGYNNKIGKQVNAFYALISDEVNSRESQKQDGSKLSTREYTDMLNEMSRKVVKEGIIWDSELDITDIPAEAMQPMADYLRRNNIPITGDNLIKGYEDPEHRKAAGLE